MSAAATSGSSESPVSESVVSISRQLPSTFCLIGPAYVDVCSSPVGSAYVVEVAERSDNTSIFRSCNRAISSAADTESADDAADFVSSDAAVTAVVPESAANTAPVSNDTSAASAASTAATASAVRLNVPRGSLPRPHPPGTHLPLSLNTTPVITP